MAIVVFDGAQSSTATNSQSTTYIVQKVLQDMPAAPDTLVASKLQDVIRDFYTNTGAWRVNIGPYNVNIGTPGQNYVVNLNPVDQYSQLQYVLAAWIYPSSPGGGNTRQFLRPSTRLIVGSDQAQPSTYFMQAPDEMVLYPIPDKAYGRVLYVYAIMLPIINTPQLPELAVTHHLDALIWGTQARMFTMKSRPWADAKLAMEFMNMYRREKLRIRDEANRAYTGVDTPIIFPPFAGSAQNGGSQMGVRNSF